MQPLLLCINSGVGNLIPFDIQGMILDISTAIYMYILTGKKKRVMILLYICIRMNDSIPVHIT